MVFGQQIASLKSKGESPRVSVKRKSIFEQNICVKRCNSLLGNYYYLNYHFYICFHVFVVRASQISSLT